MANIDDTTTISTTNSRADAMPPNVDSVPKSATFNDKRRTTITRDDRFRTKVIKRKSPARGQYEQSRESGTVDTDDDVTGGTPPSPNLPDANDNYVMGRVQALEHVERQSTDYGPSTQSRGQHGVTDDVRVRSCQSGACVASSNQECAESSDQSRTNGRANDHRVTRVASLFPHNYVDDQSEEESSRVVSPYPELDTLLDKGDKRERRVSIFPPGYLDGGSDDEIEEYHADYTDHSVAGMYRELSVSDDLTRQQLKQETRLCAIREELLSTEQNYVDKLATLVSMKERTSRLVGETQSKQMLMNIEVIHQLHRDNLLPALTNRLRNWTPASRIGDIMKRISPYLKLYTEYVKNFEAASKLVGTYRSKNITFKKLVQEITAKTYRGVDIGALLIEPVQRIPRYELLLKDYLKYLPADSEDRKYVEYSLEKVAETAKHFEEVLARDERISLLQKLQDSLDGNVTIFSFSRRLLTKAEVCVTNDKLQSAKCSLHLFNDLLLLTKEYFRVHVLRRSVLHLVDLAKSQVVPNPDPDSNCSLTVSTRKTKINLTFRNEEEMKAWENTLRKQIVECNKRKLTRRGTWENIHTRGNVAETLGKERPVNFVPETSVSVCLVCAFPFGSQKLKKHCAACGLLVCGNCSAHKMTLDYDQTTPQRVCPACYSTLMLRKTATL